MLNSGGIDAAPLVDPILTTSGDKYRTVFWPGEFIPKLDGGLGVVTPAYAQAHPDILRKVIAARRKGVDWIYAHPEAAAAYCAKFLEIDEQTAAKLLPKFIGWRFWSPGSFTKEGLETAVEGMNLAGLIQGDIDWAAYIDQQYLPEDLRSKL